MELADSLRAKEEQTAQQQARRDAEIGERVETLRRAREQEREQDLPPWPAAAAPTETLLEPQARVLAEQLEVARQSDPLTRMRHNGIWNPQLFYWQCCGNRDPRSEYCCGCGARWHMAPRWEVLCKKRAVVKVRARAVALSA